MTVSAYHSDMADETQAAQTAASPEAATTVVPPVPGRDDPANSLAWSETEPTQPHPPSWRSTAARVALIVVPALAVAAAIVFALYQAPTSSPRAATPPPPTSAPRPAPAKPPTIDQQFIARLAAEGIGFQSPARDAVLHNAHVVCDNLREFGPASRSQVAAGVQGPASGLETQQQAYMFLAAAVDYYCPDV